MGTLQQAIEIAARAHAGQTDKSGRPYICHVMAVLRYQTTDTARICAVLHDVLEDTNLTSTDLREEGFSDDVVRILDLLTRRGDENYWNYLDRVLADETACRVKLADLEDNLDPRRALPGNEKYQVAQRLVRDKLRLA